MPSYQKKDIPKIISDIQSGKHAAVYLIHGDRYLCREQAAGIIKALLPDEKERRLNLKRIDGENENFRETHALLKAHSLFSGTGQRKNKTHQGKRE